jgi:hypothetical protein
VALNNVSSSNTPAQNYVAIQAAIGALGTLLEQFAVVQQQLGNEISARQQSFSTVQSEIADTNQGLYNERSQREQADSIVTGYVHGAEVEIAQEAQSRAQADSQLHALVDAANSAIDTLRQNSATAAALQAVDNARAALQQLMETRRTECLLPRRPGDYPQAFTLVPNGYVIGGMASALPPVPTTAVHSMEEGAEAWVVGSGTLAQRVAQPVEPGRLYRARWAVRRRSDSSDPSNDTVRLQLYWLDRFGQPLEAENGFTVVRDYPGLTDAVGIAEHQCTFARSPGPIADYVAPPRARAVLAVVTCFGLDAVTGVQVLSITDATDAFLLDPPSADLEDRVTAIESDELPTRVSALESELNGNYALTFATMGDAAASSPAQTVQTIMLNGGQSGGDGRHGLYARVATLSPGADGFTTQDGSHWGRVIAAPDIISAAMSAWFYSLPTEVPDASGKPWRDNALLAWS